MISINIIIKERSSHEPQGKQHISASSRRRNFAKLARLHSQFLRVRAKNKIFTLNLILDLWHRIAIHLSVCHDCNRFLLYYVLFFFLCHRVFCSGINDFSSLPYEEAQKRHGALRHGVRHHHVFVLYADNSVHNRYYLLVTTYSVM